VPIACYPYAVPSIAHPSAACQLADCTTALMRTAQLLMCVVAHCSCQAASLYSTPTGRRVTGFDSSATVFSAGDVHINSSAATSFMTAAQTDVAFSRSAYPIIDTVNHAHIHTPFTCTGVCVRCLLMTVVSMHRSVVCNCCML
jgi:hypothetical protein